MGITSFVFRDGNNAAKDHIAGADGGGKFTTAFTPVDADGVDISPRIVDLSASFSRQANTTNYAANAVVNDGGGQPFDLANAVRKAGGSAYVVSSRLMINAAALVSQQFRLHLYKSTPGGAVDNADWPTLWTNRAIGLGWIDFLNGTSAGASPTATVWEGVPSSGMALPIIGTATDIFGVLTTLVAWTTPASGVGIEFHLRADQN